MVHIMWWRVHFWFWVFVFIFIIRIIVPYPHTGIVVVSVMWFHSIHSIVIGKNFKLWHSKFVLFFFYSAAAANMTPNGAPFFGVSQEWLLWHVAAGTQIRMHMLHIRRLYMCTVHIYCRQAPMPLDATNGSWMFTIGNTNRSNAQSLLQMHRIRTYTTIDNIRDPIRFHIAPILRRKESNTKKKWKKLQEKLSSSSFIPFCCWAWHFTASNPFSNTMQKDHESKWVT